MNQILGLRTRENAAQPSYRRVEMIKVHNVDPSNSYGSHTTSHANHPIFGRPCSGMHFRYQASQYSQKSPVSSGYILPKSSPHNDPYRTNAQNRYAKHAIFVVRYLLSEGISCKFGTSSVHGLSGRAFAFTAVKYADVILRQESVPLTCFKAPPFRSMNHKDLSQLWRVGLLLE